MPHATPEISAAIMVYNGIHTIGRCLDALGFCEEIVVVDDFSTDGTWEYLRGRPEVQAVRHLHTTLSAQRQFAKDLTHGRWLLTLDADEFVTAPLALAMLRAIADPQAPDGFFVERHTPYPQRLRGVHRSFHPRLVRSDRCAWVQTDNPHSPLRMDGLKFVTLRGGFVEHEPLDDVPSAMRKMINRSLIMAAQVEGRRRVGVPRLLASTMARFVKRYAREGVRYGRDGFLMACLSALEPFCKYVFAMSAPSDTLGQGLDGGPGSFPKGAPVRLSGTD